MEKQFENKKTQQTDLVIFKTLLSDFISTPKWTKDKHIRFGKLNQFLSGFYCLEIVETKSSLHKGYTNTFTMFEVPKKRTGKLFKYRERWVLSRKRSSGGVGWGKFWDEIYLLDFIPTEELNNRLIQEYL